MPHPKRILDLGCWNLAPALCRENLENAAREARRLGYRFARITIGEAVVLIEAAKVGGKDQATPVIVINAPGMPDRPELHGAHPFDTSTPFLPVK